MSLRAGNLPRDMHLATWLLRSGRALAALLLLTTLVVGEVADARHHLSETGCASDHAEGPQRDDSCACISLHFAPVATPGTGFIAPIPVEVQLVARPEGQAVALQAVGPAAPRGPPVA